MAVQNHFRTGYYQWWASQQEIDLPSPEYLKEQVLSSGLCILQGLLSTPSDGTSESDRALWRHSLCGWASLLANLTRTALDNSLNKPGGPQTVDVAIQTYVRLLRTCHLCPSLKSEGSTF